MANRLVQNGFRDKMTLFWHNHFVTRLEDYNCPSYMYNYFNILQINAIGNFKTLTLQIGTTPAMLVYLNGLQNTKQEPNENFARELFELFTLGRDNGYTQNDIREASKALTGWNGFTTPCAPITFLTATHDHSEKIIFGKKGNYNYEGLITLLFNQRKEKIAYYICDKLYKEFVTHANPDTTIIEGMKVTFLANNFEIKPVLAQLFKSEHFFDDYNINLQIKSPYQLIISATNQLNFNLNNDLLINLFYFNTELGQSLFNPIDVAGWRGNRNWINNNTLRLRHQLADFLAFTMYEENPEGLRTIAKQLSQESTDPILITNSIIDFFIPTGLPTDQDYKNALVIFKSEVPQNYYDDGLWNLDWEYADAQVALLIQYLFKLPEFQLY